MAKHETQYDLPALARALQRLLKRTGTEHAPSRQMVRGGLHGLWMGRPGSFAGKVATLFACVCEDDAWFQLSARPHDKTGLRKFLKASAGELHSRWGLIVSLDRQQVWIDRGEEKKK